MNTNEQKTQSNDLDALIRQTEIMEKKIKLGVQFNKNLAFFKRVNKKMYDQYVDFKPTEQTLSIDVNSEINLINIKSGNPTYSESIEKFAREQVATFIKKPSKLKIGFKPTHIINQEMIHPKLTNQVIQEYSSFGLEDKIDPKSPMGLVVMMGCGLGLQIEEIVKKHNVKNLFLFDKNKDSFYASLHVIDWEEIVTIFDQRKGKLRINVGEDCHKALYRMRTLPYEIGLHNMTTTYLFKHTESTDNQHFYHELIKNSALITSYLGFFDDEQISFSHSIHSINKNIPIFLPTNKKRENNYPPVFIIGNGPSLDNLVSFIKEHQNKAIIISCGTALASLEAVGIQPDFHVEMERNYSTAQILKSSNSAEFMKKVTLICINTVSPAVHELFKCSYTALKPNDLGANIYREFIGNESFFELPLCNPTVTNCGISYALNMGFKEVYLLGIDLGMKDSQQHHSKHSFWSKMDKDTKKNEKTSVNYSYSDQQYKIVGNFGGDIISHMHLDSSRKNVELLLESYPDVKCYNPNDGALINGAKPTLIKDIKIENNNLNKIDFSKKLINENFRTLNIPEISKKNADKKYLWLLKKSEDGLLLPNTCQDINELHKELDRIFINILAIEKLHPVTSQLIKGSLQIHSGMLTYYCARAKTQEEFNKCYQVGKETLNTLVKKSINFMDNTPLKMDNTTILNDVK